jgi:hypothetical protein
MIAATAETNRSPFDLPEGESEIIAGYYIEYSGFKFALFFLGEYLGMFAISGLGITLFLGGWSAPLPFLTWVPSWIWFFAKLLGLIIGFIWVRGTLPRLRMDQLMNFAWKFMLPMALVVVVSAGAWRFLPQGVTRWLVSTWCLSRLLMSCWPAAWRPETRSRNGPIVLPNEWGTDERSVSYSCGSDPGGRVRRDDAPRISALRAGAGGCVCRNRSALP